MKQGNFYTDNPDIQFHLKKRVDFEELFTLLCEDEKDAVLAKTADEYRQSWLEALETLGEICGQQLAPNAQKVESQKIDYKNGQTIFPEALKRNLDLLQEYGVGGFGVSPEFDGMGAPFLVEMISCELMNRACPSTMLNAGWYGSIAHVIDQFGSQELKEQYIPQIASGEMSGNMALTESDAGSDLSALKTYGVKQDDGSWKLYGNKRFITNGTSEISLVLAKSKKGAHGLDKLSLYLCPRILDGQENIKVLKLEDKVGLKASATAELAYDGAKAWILGKENEGFSYMLRLMNDSRIGVAFQGIGLMEATWRLAKQYAKERKSWGKPIEQHELIAEKLLDLETELRAIRSLSYQAAFKRTLMYAAERYMKTHKVSAARKARLQKMIKRNYRFMRNNTPLIKYWVGERSYIHARTVVQIFGGYGYTTEYKPEWWVRESLIYSLYEGTSQIQSLMYVKDTLKKIVKNPAKFVESMLSHKVKALSESDPLMKKLLKIRQLHDNAIISILFQLIKSNARSVYQRNNSNDILRLIKALSKDLVRFDDLRPALLHAERLCEIKCYEALGNTLYEDAQADSERRIFAERFLHCAVPKVQELKSMIDSPDRAIEKILDEYTNEDKKLSETGT